MRYPLRISAAGFTLSAAILIAPGLLLAQTPEPAAGNPAIDVTPAPGVSQSLKAHPSPMASPSSEAQIPKGSNPESGSGNMAAGSGATPPSPSAENPPASVLPQTASKPDDSGNRSATGTNGNGSRGPSDTMPTGKYASPPDLAPEQSQNQ